MRRCAFTLIELLIVISIIALLIGILLPVLGRARDVARGSQCLSNVRQIATASLAYATDNRGMLYPCSRMYTSINYFEALQRHGHLSKNSGVHRCPMDFDENDGWELDQMTDGVRSTSFALNAYFAPNHDPYGDPPAAHGGRDATPAQFGMRMEDAVQPSRKIFAAEIAEYKDRDHFMPMYWGRTVAIHPNPLSSMFMMARMSELDPTRGNVPRSVVRDRHNQGAHYAFVDGHASHHAFGDTWDDANDGPAARSRRTIDWYDPRYRSQ